jgi:hypothetical protein
MKKMFSVGVLTLLTLITLATVGCKSVTKATVDKQVNIKTELYGFKITAFDPATGSSSPTGMFGWGTIDYRSIPIERGQPFYASHETYSLWSNNPVSKTVIWIGRASRKSVLTFESVPNTMIKISASGIKSGEPELKVKTE